MTDRTDLEDLAGMMDDLVDLADITPPTSQLPAHHANTRDVLCAVCREPLPPVDDEPIVRYVAAGGLLAHLACWYADTDTDAGAWRLRLEMPTTYECQWCGRGLIAPDRPVKWCGPRCAQDAANDNRIAERRTARGTHHCEVCGEPFRPARSDATTCSARCRQRKRRATTKASRIPADPPEPGQHVTDPHRPVVRCREPGCPHAGRWSVPWCPPHWAAYRDHLRAEIDRAQIRQYSTQAPADGWPRPSASEPAANPGTGPTR